MCSTWFSNVEIVSTFVFELQGQYEYDIFVLDRRKALWLRTGVLIIFQCSTLRHNSKVANAEQDEFGSIAGREISENVLFNTLAPSPSNEKRSHLCAEPKGLTGSVDIHN